MSRLRRYIGLGTAISMFSTLLLSGCQQSGEAADGKTVIKLIPGTASVFHDTDQDYLGEFEGWGTSLCWWANRLGYDETLTEKAAEAFFGDSGLDLNIGRYNVGGGDLVEVNGVWDKSLASEGTAETFLHTSHIKRSDSAVPGYACDVTPVTITADTPLAWYESQFARVDAECGYAWNYNWEADANQMAILKAAAKASGEDFLAEAFSNSPPYFMTESGCSSGAEIANKNNLREDSYNAFAAYMADVIEHWNQEGIISFSSVSPLNEPYTDYWSANSNKQEGCHFDQGDSQSTILLALDKELEAKGIDIIISGTDETSIDVAIASYGALSQAAKDVISRIDTHTYGGSSRKELNNLAQQEGKNLWMSEVDGSFVAGTKAGEMGAALGFAKRIILDLDELKASAWILWNAVDMHVDSKIGYTSDADYTGWDNFNKRVNFEGGYWGIAVADHDAKDLLLTRKYYAFGQFSRYIRPGYAIISTDAENVLAAYDPEGKKAVLVAVNTSDKDTEWTFDLSAFTGISENITAVRTSGSSEEGESWADVSANAGIQADTSKKSFTAQMKGNSITTFIVENVEYDLNVHKEVICGVDDVNVSLTQGDTLVIPETVIAKRNDGSTEEKKVTWDLEGIDTTGNFETTGKVDGTEFSVKLSVMYIPEGLIYFIDCNNKKSPVYEQLIKHIELMNDAADQAYTEGSWGYLEEYGAYNGAISDIYDCGWWAKSGQTISYKIPLEAGTYSLELGFKEWWKDSNRYRYMDVYMTVGDVTTKLGVSNTWEGSDWWNMDSYELTLDKAAEVTFSVQKAANNDPVLSFIQIRDLK